MSVYKAETHQDEGLAEGRQAAVRDIKSRCFRSE
jgi:hypothetical protein